MAKKKTELKQFKTYKFRMYDPAMEEVLGFIGKERGGITAASKASGVATTTLANWRSKKTRRPQNATIEAAGRAAGKKRVWVDM